MHRRCAATNPDGRSDSPRAFWGRTDSPGALSKTGPAAGGGGTAPGAAPGIRAGSRALPVSGGGVRRADGLLGGLGAEQREGEAEREGAKEQPRRQVPAPWPQGWGGRPRRPGNRIPSFAVRSPPRRFGAPSRAVLLPQRGRLGANGAGEASRRARRMPLAQLRGPSAPRRPAGSVLSPRGAESGDRESRSPPPPRSPSRSRGRSRPLVLTRLLFPARGDRSPAPAPVGLPRLARGPAPVTATARSRLRDPRRAGRRVSGRRRGRERNFAFRGPGRRAKSSRGEPCAGTPRARWSRAHLAGPVAGEDNGVSRCCAPRFRFALPGRWVWMRVRRLHLPPWDK